MKLIRWNPFIDVDRFFDDEFFGTEHHLTPAVDIEQDEKTVTVKTSLPGVEPKDVKINIQNNILTIEGTTEKREEKKEKEYFQQEIFKGSFSRSVQLPGEVKSEEAKAASKNGMLIVTIPKMEKILPKSVKVEVTE